MPSASLGSAGRVPALQDLALTPRFSLRRTRGSRVRAGSHQGVCPQRVLELLTSLQAKKKGPRFPKLPAVRTWPRRAACRCHKEALSPHGEPSARAAGPEKGRAPGWSTEQEGKSKAGIAPSSDPSSPGR